jgi:peroxiredoxin
MPALVAARAKYGIDIVGVNPRDTAELAREFADEYGIDYRLVRDPNGASLVALGVGTFPMTYLVAGDGTILEQRAGEITAAELDRMLAPLSGSQ